MIDVVDVLTEFFNFFISQITSVINIIQGQITGVNPFILHVWYRCFPDEVTSLFILFVMIVLVIGYIKHSK